MYDGDGALKSLLVGRLGSALTGLVAILALFGVQIDVNDVSTVQEIGVAVINSGTGLFAAVMMGISTLQALYSKYKTR